MLLLQMSLGQFYLPQFTEASQQEAGEVKQESENCCNVYQ